VPRPRVFRDPIHANIELEPDKVPDGAVLSLLDTPEVQRLRHIGQLGLANLVYHGAEHSRFSHSLGVVHIAKRLYVTSTTGSGRPQDENELLVLMAAAILHDTGHPPFSHAVEKVIGASHERVTELVIRGDTQVNRILKERGGDWLVDSVVGHVRGSSDDPTTDLIHSQLDADRLDYILRDGYHAGIPNSQYDLERILQVALLDDEGLCFDPRALTAIEGFLTARYHLYLQLYFHHTVRAAEVMLRALLQRAKALADDRQSLGAISPLVESIFRDKPDEASLKISDHDLWAAFRIWSMDHPDTVLRDLSTRLLERRLFKVKEIKGRSVPMFYEQKLPAIRDLARRAGLDHNYYVRTDTAKDNPYEAADIAAATDDIVPIRLLDENGVRHSVETLSHLVTALKAAAYQKLYCCFPVELRDGINGILRD
jgi:uncharacterized protein